MSVDKQTKKRKSDTNLSDDANNGDDERPKKGHRSDRLSSSSSDQGRQKKTKLSKQTLSDDSAHGDDESSKKGGRRSKRLNLAYATTTDEEDVQKVGEPLLDTTAKTKVVSPPSHAEDVNRDHQFIILCIRKIDGEIKKKMRNQDLGTLKSL